MTLIGDWIRSRKARYQADNLRALNECRRQERLGKLIAEPYKSAAQLVEMAALREASDIFGPTRAEIFKADLDRILDFQKGGLGTGQFTDHRGRNGADFPFFASEEELARHRDMSRLVVKSNDNAAGLMGGLRCYTLGTGATVRVVPKVPAGADEAPAAQQVIDLFARENRMPFRQRWFFNFTSRDGEGIVRLFARDDGKADLRHVWPEQIRQPMGTDAEEWLFGRRCDPDDAETTLEWSVWPFNGYQALAEPEIVPAEEIVYLGPNADPGVKRSLPDFCLGTGDNLDRAETLARNMGICSAQQASIAYIRQHSGVKKSNIEAFRSADADYRQPNIYTGVDQNVKVAVPGQIIDTNENTEYKDSPYSGGIPGHLEVFQLLVRRAEARWNAPEWLATSYSQEVNFASSLTAESPFVARILEMQEYYAESFRDVFERVLIIASMANRLPRNILDLVEVKVTLPNPRTRDGLKEAQRAEIELKNGTTSPQWETEQAGREWPKVQSDLKAATANGWQPPQPPQPKPGEPGAVGQPTPTANGKPLGLNGQPRLPAAPPA